MEIPKDGKCYLAWYHLGYGFMWWSHNEEVYRDDVTKWCNNECSQVIRWMDERGQWHEISDPNSIEKTS